MKKYWLFSPAHENSQERGVQCYHVIYLTNTIKPMISQIFHITQCRRSVIISILNLKKLKRLGVSMVINYLTMRSMQLFENKMLSKSSTNLVHKTNFQLHPPWPVTLDWGKTKFQCFLQIYNTQCYFLRTNSMILRPKSFSRRR